MYTYVFTYICIDIRPLIAWNNIYSTTRSHRSRCRRLRGTGSAPRVRDTACRCSAPACPAIRQGSGAAPPVSGKTLQVTSPPTGGCCVRGQIPHGARIRQPALLTGAPPGAARCCSDGSFAEAFHARATRTFRRRTGWRRPESGGFGCGPHPGQGFRLRMASRRRAKACNP